MRDKVTMLIVMLIPVVLIVLFGFAISTEVNNVDVAVVAPERTNGVNDAVNRIAHNDYFTFCGYINQDEIDQQLRSGKVSAVIVFAPDFDRRMEQIYAGLPSTPIIQLIVDASNVNSAGAATAYMQEILLGTESQQAMFETRMLFNPQMKSAYTSCRVLWADRYSGLCNDDFGIYRTRKEVGTMEVLLVSPIRPSKIIFSKMILFCHLLFGTDNNTAPFLLSASCTDVRWRLGNLLVIAALCVIIALSGTYGLDSRQNAGHGTAYFGYGNDGTHVVAFRHALSH